MFTDPASVEKKAVPGMRALRWERGYRVDVTNKVSDGLSEVVDSFFGIIDDATDGDTGANEKKKKVVGGFKVRRARVYVQDHSLINEPNRKSWGTH
jgi:hypothetical protein